MIDRRLIQNFDWILLLALLVLMSISLMNLYSATYAIRDFGGSQVFVKQIYWFLIGFIVLLFMASFDYNILGRYAFPIYLISIGLLILVVFMGKESSGSRRWISLGPISLQPSELVKITIVLMLGKLLSDKGGDRPYRLRDLWLPFVLLGIPFILILKQPDLGTALLLIFISISMLMFVRIHWRSKIILMISGLSMIPFIWFGLKDYQKMRILSFLRPDVAPLGSGYHINQSKITIGSGLMWGKGFLKGTQTRLHFLPEQHTDFIFSVLAEEWGFASSLFLLLLYLFIILWGLTIAKNSKDRFGAILAVGIVSIFFWHVVINVGMVTGLLPVVGIPLLLFSYGGSSLVATMAAMGLLMNISMRRFMFQEMTVL